MVYHVNETVTKQGKDVKDSPRTSVQPILFPSRMLNTAEANYWPTELEIAGIVWTVKKVRHLIDSTEVPPKPTTKPAPNSSFKKRPQNSFQNGVSHKTEISKPRALSVHQRGTLLVENQRPPCQSTNSAPYTTNSDPESSP